MLHRLSLLLLLLCSAIVAPATLTVYNMKAWGIWTGPSGNADGYVKVYCDNHHIGTTQVKKNTVNPEWEESFSYGRASSGSVLKLIVYDKIVFDNIVRYDSLLGNCEDIIRTGDHQHTCNLSSWGKLQYRYSLH